MITYIQNIIHSIQRRMTSRHFSLSVVKKSSYLNIVVLFTFSSLDLMWLIQKKEECLISTYVIITYVKRFWKGKKHHKCVWFYRLHIWTLLWRMLWNKMLENIMIHNIPYGISNSSSCLYINYHIKSILKNYGSVTVNLSNVVGVYSFIDYIFELSCNICTGPK